MYFNTFFYSLTVSIIILCSGFHFGGSSYKWTPLGCEKGIHNIGAGRLWECKNTEFVFVKVAGSRAACLGLRVSVRRASTIVIIGNPCSF